MNDEIYNMRQKIAEIGARMFARRLTDSAGGNISLRMDDLILMTPRYAGSKYNWQLTPEQILVLDLLAHKMEGEGEISREYQAHFKLLTGMYPAGKAVLHGHSLNVLVFCATGKPIPPVLDSGLKIGRVELVPAAAAHSSELAERILIAMREKEQSVQQYAAAVLAPRHGVFVFAKDLMTGYDALERIEVNAYCALMSKLVQ